MMLYKFGSEHRVILLQCKKISKQSQETVVKCTCPMKHTNLTTKVRIKWLFFVLMQHLKSIWPPQTLLVGFHICPYGIRKRHFCYYSIYLDTYGICDFRNFSVCSYAIILPLLLSLSNITFNKYRMIIT